MTPSQQAIAPVEPPDPQDFSLVLGGPLFQLMRRAHIADDTLALLTRRILVLAVVAWLPLFLLAGLEGHAFGGSVAVPFLQDVEVHARFLVALPLLVLAELVVHQRMRPVVHQFLDRGLVRAEDVPRFLAARDAAMRLRNSVFAEVLLLAIVYLVGVPLVWRQYFALTTATWYATPGPGGSALTLGGWWFGGVSVPVFQFLLLRWYFRILVWVRFLWQVSRIPLQLIPTHPDRVGGLGFLGNTVHAFLPLAMAHGALMSGWIASRIFHLGAGLLDFKVEVGVLAGFLLCVVCCPFLVFSSQLAQAKRRGLREYGTLAGRYVREFDARWLRGGAKPDEPLLGSADLQSLADLGSSFDVVREMRLVPVGRDALLQLAAAILLPIVPLALTMMSLEDLLGRLFGVVM